MDDLVARLSRMDTCAVSDALDKLGLKGVVTGIDRFSTERGIAGRVLTVKLDRDKGESQASRHLSTAAIEAANPGDVIVVEQRTGIDAAGWGGNLSLGAKLRGVSGAIVEGPARRLCDCRRERRGVRRGRRYPACSGSRRDDRREGKGDGRSSCCGHTDQQGNGSELRADA